ncbi:MAG: hypothetical protein K6G90_12105 [Clostridia bacterium]|nr:hypothetical protein [Clostridia bacterium]
MKDYQIVRCPFCTAQSYDRTARKRKTPGSCVFTCPKCGKKSYRQNKLEPALLSYGHYYEITFGMLYRVIRILVVLIYVLLAVYVYMAHNNKIAMIAVAGALGIFVICEAVRRIHGKKYKNTAMYKKAVEDSLERLKSINYSELVFMYQNAEEGCPYLEENESGEQSEESGDSAEP